MKNIFKKISLLWTLPILGIIGLIIFINFYNRVFPEASLNMNITQEKAVQIAGNYLLDLGFNVSGYKIAPTFLSDDSTSIYLQKTVGTEEANRLIKKDFPVWAWNVRFWKPLQKEEYSVYLDCSNGQILAFSQILDEEAIGAKLSQDEARKIAEDFLSKKYNLADYKEISASTEEQKNRTDHSFVWHKKDYKIGDAEVYIAADVYGDKVGYLASPTIDIPESFSRSLEKVFAQGNLLVTISLFLTFFFGFLALILFIKKCITKEIKWTLPLVFSLGLFSFSIADLINNLPQLFSTISTAVDQSTSIGLYVLPNLINVIISALLVFIFAATGDSFSREVFKRPSIDLSKTSIIAGYSLLGITLGLVTGFYFFANKYFGAWALFSGGTQNFSVFIPAFVPIFVGISAALNEEIIYRFFSISVLKKYIKYSWVAIFIPAIIWGFAHANYAVFPIGIRGIEVTLIGLIAGYIFLRYGLFATLIYHFSFNVILTSIPLLRSGYEPYFVQGIISLSFILIPLILVLLYSKFHKLNNINYYPQKQ